MNDEFSLLPSKGHIWVLCLYVQFDFDKLQHLNKTLIGFTFQRPLKWVILWLSMFLFEGVCTSHDVRQSTEDVDNVFYQTNTLFFLSLLSI